MLQIRGKVKWSGKTRGRQRTLGSVEAVHSDVLQLDRSIPWPRHLNFSHQDGVCAFGRPPRSMGQHPLQQEARAVHLHEGISAPERLSPLSPFSQLSAEELPLTICCRISQSSSTCPQDFSPKAVQLLLLFIVCLLFSFLREVLFCFSFTFHSVNVNVDPRYF